MSYATDAWRDWGLRRGSVVAAPPGWIPTAIGWERVWAAYPDPSVPRPDRDGVFTLGRLRVFIPCRLRIAHDCPVRTSPFEVQYRATPHLYGHSSATLILKDYECGARYFLPWIAVPFVRAQLLGGAPWPESVAEKRDRWLEREFLPCVRTVEEKGRILDAMEALLAERWDAAAFSTQSIRRLEVETSADQYAQLLFALTSRPAKRRSLNECVTSALKTGTWTRRRVGVTRRIPPEVTYSVYVDTLRTIIVRQSLTRGRLVEQRQLTDPEKGFLAADGSPDGDNVGLHNALALYAFVCPVTHRLSRVDSAGAIVPCTADGSTEDAEEDALWTMGVLGAQHCFAAHNQSARATLAYGARKQYVGAEGGLHNGQRPLVQGAVRINEGCGANLFVAFLTDTHTIEDCVVLNRAAVDRGLFFTLRRHTEEVTPDEATEARGAKRARFETDLSGASGRVTRVLPDSDTLEVLVECRPQPGDKLTNRHGQKCTVSELRAPEDMPFVVGGNMDGVAPDVIVNGAMSLLKRMTVGMLLEMLGVEAEAPFDERGVMMCDGRTGALFPSRVAFGPVFYGRMEQMAASKLNVRTGEGPVDPVTGAPVKSRKAGGGIQFGHMEFDGVLGHGAAEVVHERNTTAADGIIVYHCMACPGVVSRTQACARCGSRFTHAVQSSGASEAMVAELATAGVLAVPVLEH